MSVENKLLTALPKVCKADFGSNFFNILKFHDFINLISNMKLYL